MNPEHAVVCGLLRSRDFKPVVERRLERSHFTDPDHRQVFEFIVDHHRRYGEVPSAAAVRSNWPSYPLQKLTDDLSFFLDEVVNAHLHRQLVGGLSDVYDALNEHDPRLAQKLIAALSIDTAPLTNASVDIDATTTWKERIARYEEWARQGPMRGLPTGFASIDRATLGLQPEQLIFLIGVAKVGKSQLLLKMAHHIHSSGRRPLVIGFEMSNPEQLARYDAISARLNHLDLLAGRLRPKDKARLIEESKKREGFPEFIFSADIAAATTVSGIAAKIEEHKPDVCLVDGIYLMEDERGEPKGSPQALTNITRDLKRLAQRIKIPLVGTTQALESKIRRKDGITSGATGYSSSFAQDCDVMIGVDRDPNLEDGQRLRVLLSRSGPRVETVIQWDWETSTFEEFDEDGAEV